MDIKNMTIHQLRLAGNKVRVTHKRYAIQGYNYFFNQVLKTKGVDILRKYLIPIKGIRADNQQNLINPKGGSTTIDITTKNGQEYSATAFCNLKDSFNRKTAISICLGRIGEQMEKEKAVEMFLALGLKKV